jgi:hypothetical protein
MLERRGLTAGRVGLLLVGTTLARAVVSRSNGYVFILLAAGLAFMALDEVAEIHEHLEAFVGLDWQSIYIPGFVAALVVLISVARRMRHDAPRAVLVLAAGTAAWVVSQVLEVLEWHGSVQQPGYVYMMFAEEILEMFGSIGFVVALLELAEDTTRWNDVAHSLAHREPDPPAEWASAKRCRAADLVRRDAAAGMRAAPAQRR